MSLFLKSYIVSLLVFSVIDAVWLGVIAKNLYADSIGFLMRPQPNWVAAIIFYLLFIGGLVFFAVQPGRDMTSLPAIFLTGAFFGLVTYGTYDLTNLATLKNWPVSLTLIDLAWGAFISGTTTLVTRIILK